MWIQDGVLILYYIQQVMTESIKIIVRVRPFNQNEKDQGCVVEMSGQQVRVRNPHTGEVKPFAFHRCYWSVDDSLGKPPVNNAFVFDDIGNEILDHIYQGYNSTIFAYGQTGAGKSYSIEGYEEKGILQLCLSDIFCRKKKENDANGIITTVRVSYLEIYNEKLRDLLNPNSKQEVKVQSAGTRVFISGTDPVLCESYDEVLKMFSDGKKIRVIGSHKMNATSSRSHAVFTIYYKQTGKGKQIEAKFNVVDLAGSERLAKTGAEGVRLEQANNINKSLTNLGIVIEKLAVNATNRKNEFVPYRNSLLTHILSESLGGNSKTFMIAAVSPASSNFEQTLSTLRFAYRASLIKTESKKNVEQKEGYNKELIEEIQRLKQELLNTQNKTTYTHSHSNNVEYITMENESKVNELQAKINLMLEELQKNKSVMEDLEKQLQNERIRKAEMQENRKKALKEAGFENEQDKDTANLPYLMNISEDPTLAGMLIYHIKEGETKIGTNEAEENDIKLNALGVSKRHCAIIRNGEEIALVPNHDSKIFINGRVITQKKDIRHLDRIILGHANTFKLVIPGAKASKDQSVARYGQFLDDRLNSDSPEAKNTKMFLQELEQRLDKDTFGRFMENFKNSFRDIDDANDYTAFRYKKYPLKNKNISFRLNVIIDIQNYMKGEPSLIILCENRESKAIEFIWSEQKFAERLAEMQSWYSDVSGGSHNQASFYEFDPWFDATDNFIKEKEQLELMNAQQIHQFWSKKQTETRENYGKLLKEQDELIKTLAKQGVNADLVEDYADFYFRDYDDIPEPRKTQVEQLRKKEEIHSLIKRFMEYCAEIQKCNLDNKAFNHAKNKYAGNHSDENIKSDPPSGFQQENAWLMQHIDELEDQIRKANKEIVKLQKASKK